MTTVAGIECYDGGSGGNIVHYINPSFELKERRLRERGRSLKSLNCPTCSAMTEHKINSDSLPVVRFLCFRCGSENKTITCGIPKSTKPKHRTPKSTKLRPQPKIPKKVLRAMNKKGHRAKSKVRAINSKLNQLADEILFGPREFRQFD